MVYCRTFIFRWVWSTNLNDSWGPALLACLRAPPWDNTALPMCSFPRYLKSRMTSHFYTYLLTRAVLTQGGALRHASRAGPHDSFKLVDHNQRPTLMVWEMYIHAKNKCPTVYHLVINPLRPELLKCQISHTMTYTYLCRIAFIHLFIGQSPWKSPPRNDKRPLFVPRAFLLWF